MIGEDKVIRFSGVQRGEACTVVLRGPSMQILDEAERSLHDALCVLSQGNEQNYRIDNFDFWIGQNFEPFFTLLITNIYFSLCQRSKNCTWSRMCRKRNGQSC